MSTVPLLRIFGFEIRIHVSWAIILAVVAVTVAAQVDAMAPLAAPQVRWIVAAVVSGALLVSAILHELGHAIVGRRVGVPVGPVVVYFFGAAASPALTVRRARDEILVGLAGPLVSLGLGGLLLLVSLALGVVSSASQVQVAGDLILVIGLLNVALGVFNLLPAFPLDGGRVVRGLAWARSGDVDGALRVAATVGRWFGLGLAAAGIVSILFADSIDGLMVALCGWFLISTASGVRHQATIDAIVGNLRVGEVMDREVQGIVPGLTLDTFADRVLDGSVSSSLPVVQGGLLVGVIGAAQVRRVPRKQWATTRISDVMIRPPGMPVVDSETSIRVVLDSLQRTGLDGLPVVDAGALAGVVTRRGVADALRTRTLDQRARLG